MNEYKSAIDYLVREQGVLMSTVENLEKQGFRHTTMICGSIPEQMEYERSLKTQFNPNDVHIIPLNGGGRAYWVRDVNKRTFS